MIFDLNFSLIGISIGGFGGGIRPGGFSGGGRPGGYSNGGRLGLGIGVFTLPAHNVVQEYIANQRVRNDAAISIGSGYSGNSDDLNVANIKPPTYEVMQEYLANQRARELAANLGESEYLDNSGDSEKPNVANIISGMSMSTAHPDHDTPVPRVLPDHDIPMPSTLPGHDIPISDSDNHEISYQKSDFLYYDEGDSGNVNVPFKYGGDV